MIERLALVLVLALIGYGVFYLFRMSQMRRMSNVHQTAAPVMVERAPALQGHGTPTLLYFRADSCAVCPTQSRHLDQLASMWDGPLTIEKIDAERDPETAGRYGVISLPTTVLVDPQGQVRQINYGLTDARKLSRQLAAVVGMDDRQQTANDSVRVA